MKKLWAALIIIIPMLASAQSYFMRHYSVEDGILSSEIYARAQDTIGYLWFATSRGISRFDGQNFHNYTVKDGLPTNSIITMFADENGNIWFAGYDGSLSYHRQGKIIPYKYYKTVKKLSQDYYINNLFVDKNYNLYFAPNQGGFFKIDSSGKVFRLDTMFDPNYRYVIYFIKNQAFFIKQNTHIKDKKTRIKREKNIIYLNIPGPALRRHVVKHNSEIFLTIGKKLYSLQDTAITLIKEFPNEISGIYFDRDNNLWISVLYNGVFLYPGGHNQNIIHLLDKKSPIQVLEDNEGGYWIPTTESGIYYLPSFDFVNYNNLGLSQYNITSIAGQGKQLYFATFNQKLYKCIINGKNILRIIPVNLMQKNYTVNDILIDNQGIWLLGKYLFHLSPQGQKKLIAPISRGYSLAKANDGNILATASYGFVKICNFKICHYFRNQDIPTSNSIYQSPDGTIWLGSINGLFSLKDSSLFFWGKKHKILKTRINHISQIDRYILLATSGAGLVMLNLKDSSIRIIDRNSGITSDFVTHILVKDSVAWVGTNKGLAKIVFSSFDPLDMKIYNFTQTDGLASEEIRSLTITDNTVFLATTKGLVSLSPQIKKKIVFPKMVIDSILIDDKKIPLSKKIVLSPSQNSITVFFKGISFHAGKNIIYRYKLDGLDTRWNITKNRYIKFSKLPHGNYTLYLTAAAQPNYWNPQPVTFTIIKKRHFSETPYFYLLLFILATGTIAIVSYIILKNKHKQIEHERKLIAAEQKALRSQMNPHFIFNALNSIRRFILENDTDKADYYLTRFATLMRKVLDNSRQNFITLENEIQTLKLYLELEKMRFDNSFSFQINIDPDIDTKKWLIPPMIIQPFVENAIWHGLALKNQDGKLNITFHKKSPQMLECIVDDNGIGREKARQIAAKRKGHKSTGLINTRERMNLITRLYKKNIDLTIIDKYDQDGNPAGTKVIITLPNFNDY